MQNLPNLVAFSCLFVAMLLACLRQVQWAFCAVFLSVTSGVFSGICGPSAYGIVAVGAGLAWQAQAPQAWRRASALSLLIVLALALGFHLFPTFSPWRLQESFGRDGARAIVWHLDKGLAGLFLLAAMAHSRRIDTLTRLALMCVAVVVSVLALTWLMGLAHWQAAWLPGVSLWLLGNLFLTVLPEEVFFRGMLQQELMRSVAKRLSVRAAEGIALVAASLLFGLVHAPWGWTFALLASIAGAGYGWMYLRGGLAWAVLAHFAVNASLVLVMRSPLA